MNITDERIQRALALIESGEVDELPPGRHDIADGLYVSVSEYETKAAGLFEAHKKYLDIQYMIAGEEYIEFAKADEMNIVTPYDEEKDIEYGTAEGGQFLLGEKKYRIIRPEEAHLPGLRIGESKKVKKAVFKVRIG